MGLLVLKAISFLERLIEFLRYPRDVNEDGAIAVPEFVPTREELLKLAKHWEVIFLQRAYFIFCTDQEGSTERRLAQFAERRVMRIIRLLRQDAIQTVRGERDAFAKRMGLPKWKRFRKFLGPNHLHGENPVGPPRQTVA